MYLNTMYLQIAFIAKRIFAIVMSMYSTMYVGLNHQIDLNTVIAYYVFFA